MLHVAVSENTQIEAVFTYVRNICSFVRSYERIRARADLTCQHSLEALRPFEI